MDFNSFLEMIGTYGFSVVGMCVLAWVYYKDKERDRQDHKEREEKLYKEITENRTTNTEMRVANRELIETNKEQSEANKLLVDRFTRELTEVKTDIKEIKSHIIKNN